LAARLIKRVVCIGEDSCAQRALAFELLDTGLDLTGSVALLHATSIEIAFIWLKQDAYG